MNKKCELDFTLLERRWIFQKNFYPSEIRKYLIQSILVAVGGLFYMPNTKC